MYETTFKNIDDTLWKDAGCSSELDYIEQTSWILFLKYLDDFESDKETAALLNGENYNRIIEAEFRWTEWAAPKRADGLLDYNIAMTGDDLRDFVNLKLFVLSRCICIIFVSLQPQMTTTRKRIITMRILKENWKSLC